ncbi:MAG: hypothetical protein GYB65_20615, partial [Chloroflexi bacterium]|nr:hypothetical protein [Chloroflexota bacterium]
PTRSNRIKRTIAVIVVLVISTLALLPVEAQGSLDDAEEKALFERPDRAADLLAALAQGIL